MIQLQRSEVCGSELSESGADEGRRGKSCRSCGIFPESGGRCSGRAHYDGGKGFWDEKVAIAGGVASNGTLRAAMEQACKEMDTAFTARLRFLYG